MAIEGRETLAPKLLEQFCVGNEMKIDGLKGETPWRLLPDLILALTKSKSPPALHSLCLTDGLTGDVPDALIESVLRKMDNFDLRNNKISPTTVSSALASTITTFNEPDINLGSMHLKGAAQPVPHTTTFER